MINKIRTYIFASTNKKISKHNFESIWTVRQFENEYNPTHYHSGHISGVGYLQVPENFGESVQKSKKQNPNGKLLVAYIHFKTATFGDCSSSTLWGEEMYFWYSHFSLSSS